MENKDAKILLGVAAILLLIGNFCPFRKCNCNCSPEVEPDTDTKNTIESPSVPTCDGIPVIIGGLLLTKREACSIEPMPVTVYANASPIVVGTRIFNDKCLTEPFTYFDSVDSLYTNIDGAKYTISPIGVILSLEYC